LIGVRTIHIGTVNLSVVGPREVFREAVRENAVSVIVGHNHPSGDPTPSPEDINITHRLRAVGEMLDIPVLDHVVVASRGFVSLVESGMV
jgi:DNA repair protein RadC